MLGELEEVLHPVTDAALRPDGVTVAVIKMIFSESPEDLLHIVNYFLRHAWIPFDWHLPKVTEITETWHHVEP